MNASQGQRSAIGRLSGLLGQPPHAYRPSTEIFLDLNVNRVADNLNLLVLDQLKTSRLMSPIREKRNALDWIRECRIKTPSPSTLCANLSGGNQQKVVIAKWLTSQIRFLVLDHPTRGVDVGAKEEIYRLIRKLASDGVGMIVMCDTLEEDIGLCSRMLIMKDGRLVREIDCPPFRKPSPSEIIGSIV